MSNLFHPILLPSWSSPAVLTTSALLLLVVLYPLVFGTRRKDSDVYELGGLSILTTWSFFNRRSDFLTSSFAKTGQKLLSFKVLHVCCCIVHLPYQDKDPTFFSFNSTLWLRWRERRHARLSSKQEASISTKGTKFSPAG